MTTTNTSTTTPDDRCSPDTQQAWPVQTLPVDLVVPGPAQARNHFDSRALDELAASIAEAGVLQPVIVRGDTRAGYRLLAGERRWRAAQIAGIHSLPAVVRNDLSDAHAAVLGLIENLQRESLGVMETAHGLARLCADHGLTHDGVARRIGKSRVYVTNYLRLCNLSETVQTRVDSGALSLGHAKILAGLSSARQQEFARKAANGGMSVRRLEQAIRRADNSDPPAPGKPGEMADLEARLSEHVGNAVRIDYQPDRRVGELRIAFHDLDEFDGLLERLGFNTE